MRLYRKIIAKIAKEIIQSANSKKLIEVDSSCIEEAELDVASIMVEHLNSEEKVDKEAVDTLRNRGLPNSRFVQVKKSIAEVRNVKVGEDGIAFVIDQILEVLFSSKNVAEIYAEDIEMRRFIKEIIYKYLKLYEEVESEAKMRLKNLKEGSPEWNVEYPRMVYQLKRQKGLV